MMGITEEMIEYNGSETCYKVKVKLYIYIVDQHCNIIRLDFQGDGKHRIGIYESLLKL